MKSLKKYLTNNSECWDGHIHLFDHSGYIDLSLIYDKYKCVCFADIVFKQLDMYRDKKVISLYDNFINNYYNSKKHILLATGITAGEIIEIYKKYPNIIKGFGELKCYSEFDGGKLPYADLTWIKPLLEFNKELNLPVYIHYELANDKYCKVFKDILSEYPKMPIVLCHCGMIDDKTKNADIHSYILSLMNKFDNLYLDISTCKTRQFYLDNLNYLMQLNFNRVITGSDINPIAKTSNIFNDDKKFKATCYTQMNNIYKYIKCSGINRLFKLK